MSQFFLTTHWTRVLASRGNTPEARQALSDLCADYYAPVLTFLRQSGHSEDAARDLAHEFFATLLERHGLDAADPQRGRFRSFLLGAVKHFLANQRASARRQKRGGGAEHVAIGVGTETSPGLTIPDPAALPTDALFDREWALNLLDRALTTLARESGQDSNPAQFEALKPYLTGAPTGPSQTDVARQLRMTEGAVRVAIHRLRRRFRELVKAEIAQTVETPAQIDQELNHLIAALS